jgi:hypothetical protein
MVLVDNVKWFGLLLITISSVPVLCMDPAQALRHAVTGGSIVDLKRVVEAIPEAERKTFVNQYLDQYDSNIGLTALHLAAQGNDADKVQYLLEVGADSNRPTYWNETPLHVAACDSRNPEVARILLEAGASIGAKNWQGTTPLMFAIMHNNAPVIALLSEYVFHTEAHKIGSTLALATNTRLGEGCSLSMLPQQVLRDITLLAAQAELLHDLAERIPLSVSLYGRGQVALNKLMKSRGTQRRLVRSVGYLAGCTAAGAATERFTGRFAKVVGYGAYAALTYWYLKGLS